MYNSSTNSQMSMNEMMEMFMRMIMTRRQSVIIFVGELFNPAVYMGYVCTYIHSIITYFGLSNSLDREKHSLKV